MYLNAENGHSVTVKYIYLNKCILKPKKKKNELNKPKKNTA